MIRTFISAAFFHPFVWNVELARAARERSGQGRPQVRLLAARLVHIGAVGLGWTAAWVDRQDDADGFEAWAWFADGRVTGKIKVVTPRTQYIVR